jgi:hypothetical protein
MATYDSLSASDKAVVQHTVQLIRETCGSTGRNFNYLEAIEADTNAINLIMSIDAGETIPNQSGLAGADDMTRSEIASIWTDLMTMKTSHDTASNRAAWSKAVGVSNLLGR